MPTTASTTRPARIRRFGCVACCFHDSPTQQQILCATCQTCCPHARASHGNANRYLPLISVASATITYHSHRFRHSFGQEYRLEDLYDMVEAKKRAAELDSPSAPRCLSIEAKLCHHKIKGKGQNGSDGLDGMQSLHYCQQVSR